MVETFATDLFPPTRLRWRIAATPVTGGQPVAGPPATGDVSAGGWWVAEHQPKTLNKLSEVRQWRALAGRLRNGAVPIVVPVVDALQPWPDGIVDDSGVPHSDGAPFSDGSLYTSRLIDYSLAADAALRATGLQLTRTAGGILKGGEYFTLTGSLYGDRLHLVGSVTAVIGDTYTIEFSPPLREDYAAGTFADFQQPRCTMKLALTNIDDMWPELERPFRATPKAVFAETLS